MNFKNYAENFSGLRKLTLIHRISTDHKMNFSSDSITLTFYFLLSLHIIQTFLIWTSIFRYIFHKYLSKLHLQTQEFLACVIQIFTIFFQILTVNLRITFTFDLSFVFNCNFISILLSMKPFVILLSSTILIKSYNQFGQNISKN